jgi:hypothetical protein
VKRRWLGVLGIGLGLVVLAVVRLVLAAASVRGPISVVDLVAPLLAWLGLVVAVWALVQDTPTVETIGQDAVEESSVAFAVVGTAFADEVAAAAEQARTAESVDAGLASLRPRLRATLVATLVAGGASRSDALQAVATGRWTDDELAAAVCSERCRPPAQPFRERCRAWLFPGRVLRERVRRAAAAIQRTGEAALPAVPGEGAPESVPVARQPPGAGAETIGLQRDGRRRGVSPTDDRRTAGQAKERGAAGTADEMDGVESAATPATGAPADAATRSAAAERTEGSR